MQIQRKKGEKKEKCGEINSFVYKLNNRLEENKKFVFMRKKVVEQYLQYHINKNKVSMVKDICSYQH